MKMFKINQSKMTQEKIFATINSISESQTPKPSDFTVKKFKVLTIRLKT